MIKGKVRSFERSDYTLSDEIYESMAEDIRVLCNREDSLTLSKQEAERQGFEIPPPKILSSEPTKISISSLPCILYWFEGGDDRFCASMSRVGTGMREGFLFEADDEPMFCFRLDEGEVNYMIFHNGDDYFSGFKNTLLNMHPKTQFISRKRPIFEKCVGAFRKEIQKQVDKNFEGHKWLRRAFVTIESGDLSKLAYRRTMELTNTECRMCGVCCERLLIITPDFKKDQGERCPNLAADNRCDIFEDRPRICRGWPNLSYSRVLYDVHGVLIDINTCPIVREWWQNLSFVLTGRHPDKYRVVKLDGKRERKSKKKKGRRRRGS